MDKESKERLKVAARIIEDIDFPSLPLYIQFIKKELQKKEPSLRKIANYVSQDIALTAKVLKLVNSAAYTRGNKVENILQGITILGINTFNTYVIEDAIKRELSSHSISEEFFGEIWQHSLLVAKTAQEIATDLNFNHNRKINPNYAYLSGLFHDCGIPIMAARFDNYEQLIQEELQQGKSIYELEDKSFNTRHSAVSYIVAKLWELPEDVAHSLYFHSDADLIYYKEETQKELALTLKLAESILSELDTDNPFSLEAIPLLELSKLTEELWNINAESLDMIKENIKEIIEM